MSWLVFILLTNTLSKDFSKFACQQKRLGLNNNYFYLSNTSKTCFHSLLYLVQLTVKENRNKRQPALFDDLLAENFNCFSNYAIIIK